MLPGHSRPRRNPRPPAQRGGHRGAGIRLARERPMHELTAIVVGFLFGAVLGWIVHGGYRRWLLHPLS